MVSRSLEKMLLIAIGLTTVVMVGVPVLLYTMNIISNASQLEVAQDFAEELHNATAQVDQGSLSDFSSITVIPQYVEVSAVGNSLTVSFQVEGGEMYTWTEVYAHSILLTAPEGSGTHIVEINLDEDILEITFSTNL
ncbi:MAG: hypothetical protein P1Q69_09445 [Candidatus Thorarchaeota archaeon]|nr:hypothetical protein [Candidatus Thorarchaeota archaeon]